MHADVTFCVAAAAVAVNYALISGVDYEPSTLLTFSSGVPSTTACGTFCNSYGAACASFLYDTGGSGNCTLYGPTTAAPSSLSADFTLNSAVQTTNGFAVLPQSRINFVQSIAQTSSIEACPGLCTGTCEFAVFNSVNSICTTNTGPAIFSASVSATYTTFARQNIQYATS